MNESFVIPEMCRYCDKENQTLPAIEHFQDRYKNPKLYFAFYRYFLRAVTGDTKWKLGMKDSSTRITTSIAEAYAHTLVANNYFSWLFEYKAEFWQEEDLTTAYEVEPDDDGSLQMFHVKETDTVEIMNDEMDHDGDFSCLCDPTEVTYKAVQKCRQDQEEETRKEAVAKGSKNKRTFDYMNKKLKQYLNDNTQVKKRKVLGELKTLTGKFSSDDKDEPSSVTDKTNKFLYEFTKTIKEDVKEGKHNKFELRFREIAGLAETNEKRSPNKENRYVVNCDDIYDEPEGPQEEV